ncbi:MAG: SLBB domain-containing protein, partial [Kangiellaceae bacterium]|nr:SLBB domain-containing protein [Kangiellaceae bacterium]
KAFPNISHISRKHKNGYTTVVDVDPSKLKSNRQKVKNGDIIDVSTVLKEMDNIVKLSGAFQRPRAIQWFKGLKLSDVIGSVKDFRDDVDLNIGLIIRQELPLKHISVSHFDLKGLLAGDKESEVFLQPMDEVLTFAWATNERERTFEQELRGYQTEQQKLRRLEQVEIDSDQQRRADSGDQIDLTQELEEKLKSHNRRTAVLASIIKRLREQTNDGGLIRIVDISGNVRFPGTYPLTQKMTARDLVLLAGGLKEASYLGNAEVTRRDLSNSESAKIVHFNINLAEELTGRSRFSLSEKDKLAIYTTPEYREKLAIQLEGEVRFPGLYEFRRGETLSQVIERAGGFTSMAHIHAAVFTRRDLKIQEAKRLEELKIKMREDIAASELENAEAGRGGGIQDAEALLNALTKAEAIGRLVVSLDDIVTGRTDDIHLKDGDRLVVPTFRQEISVVGEVQHSTSHLYNDEWTLDDYLEKSGGYTQRADDDRIYVVRSDGSVFLPNQSNWLSHQNEMLSPGDTIVVPLDTDRIKSLSLWTSVSQIVYQLALGAAAIKNLSN